MSGFYSPDGFTWTKIGSSIDAVALDRQQTDFNNFTGNQQGLYVEGKSAFFDLYIYRDAYTNIAAQHPANRLGVNPSSTYLGSINNDDWALYAGVEFGGNADYPKTPVSFGVIASSAASGGVVEVWLDSIDTGNKIAECDIESTGDWENFEVFTSDVDSVAGRHDVYLKFTGDGTDELFRIQWLKFLIEGDSISYIEESNSSRIPETCVLEQNYPNPFALSTTIKFGIPSISFVSLKVYNILGQEVVVIAEKEFSAGVHSVTFDASNLASGMYLYKIEAKDTGVVLTKKMILVK